jgi:hypothetical protein
MNEPQSIHTALLWWIENMQNSFKIFCRHIQILLYTLALHQNGRGIQYLTVKTNGFWTNEEQ